MSADPHRELTFSQDAYDFALDERSYDTWIEQLRNEERSPAAVMFELLGDAMTPFLLFLADGFKGQRNTFAERTWVLLYCVRPDLLDATTTVAAARRYGFNQTTLCHLGQDFDRRFPGVVVKAKRDAWTIEHKQVWVESRKRNAVQRKQRHKNFDTRRLMKNTSADMAEFDRALGLVA